MPIEVFGVNTKWKLIGPKQGGARKSDGLGGIYKNTENDTVALIKRDPQSPNFDIAEYLCSQMFNELSPGYGAKVEFMVPRDQVPPIPNDGSNVYVRSEFFENYADMFKDMNSHLPKQDRPSSLFSKDGRPLMMGTRQTLNGVISKAFKQTGYQGFDKVAPASLLIGDFDMHTGNIGVIREPGRKPYIVRIDFGWGLSKLTRKVHPHSNLRHLPVIGPTNHFGEFPLGLKLNKQFANGLDKVAGTNLDRVVGESFSELQRMYSPSTIRKWAIHAMPNEFSKKNIDKVSIAQIENTFRHVMKDRQASIKEFSLQIKLGLAITKKDKYYQVDREEIQALVKDNPSYFEELLSGKKNLKFRDPRLNNRQARNFVINEIRFALSGDIVPPGINRTLPLGTIDKLREVRSKLTKFLTSKVLNLNDKKYYDDRSTRQNKKTKSSEPKREL